MNQQNATEGTEVNNENSNEVSESNEDASITNGEQLSLIGQSLNNIPINVDGAHKIKRLDLSYNNIIKLENLEQFQNLTYLVVDNNQLESDQSQLPKIQSLQTLWVNSNNIDDLKIFLDCVSNSFPNLTYLSMLKNPACPNYFTGKDFEDYKRYRYYVLYRMKKLKFLDYSAVSNEERKEAGRRGQYVLTVKIDPSQIKVSKPPTQDDEFPQLPEDLQPEGKGSARFGISSYVYVGKHSEGNRFITNDNL